MNVRIQSHNKQRQNRPSGWTASPPLLWALCVFMNNPSKLVALLESKYQEARIDGSQDMRETLMAGLN